MSPLSGCMVLSVVLVHVKGLHKHYGPGPFNNAVGFIRRRHLVKVALS